MKAQVFEQHQNCQVAIRYKRTKWQCMAGLFCQKHNHFIDWLSQTHADYAIYELDVQVEPWLDKKQSQRNKTPMSYLQKKKRHSDMKKRITKTHE